MRPRLSFGGLRPWLLASVILPFTVVLLGLAVAGIEIHGRAMRSLVAERDERSARAASQAISAELFHRLMSVRSLALRLRDGAPAARVIEDSSVLRPDFPQGLAVVAASDAGVIAGTLSPPVSRRTVLDVLVTRQKEAFLRPLAGEKGAIVLAVFPSRPLAVVGAFSLSDLLLGALPWLEAPATSASAVIFDSEGEELAHIGAPIERDHKSHKGVRAALTGATGSLYLTPPGGEEHVVAYSTIRPPGWALMIEEPWQSVESPVLRFSLAAPLSLVPILVISLAGLWFAARQVVSPLRDLQSRALKLAAGDFEAVEKEIGGVQEIRDLHRSMIQMARRIQSAQQSLRRYIGRVTLIQEEERRRLARDLHDETIQDLIALDQKVQLLARNVRAGASRKSDSLETIHREAREAIQRVRRLSLALRPGYLEDLGLLPALEALASDVSSKAGIPVRLRVEGTSRELSAEVDLAVYRIVQESLANVIRHAEARHAWVDMRFARDELRLVVRDDGIGFVPPGEAGDLTQAGHFGLVGMRERAQFVGGGLEVSSARGKGTRLTLRLPLRS